jgi:hypothetical protein
MTIPRPGPEPNATAPPALSEIFSTIFINLVLASWVVGIFGGLTLYMGSFFATMSGSMFSDTLYFHEQEFRFMAWCGLLLDRHLAAFLYYLAGLFFLPLVLLITVSVPRSEKHPPGGGEGCANFLSGRPFPGRTWVRVFACMLYLPFVPTLLAALAGLAVVLFVLSALALYALFISFRFFGFRYLWTRVAVRDGMRDALGPRRR